MSKITQRLNLGYAKVFRPTMVQRHIREWPDSGPTVARQHPTGPDTPTVRAQGHRSCGQTRPTPPTPPTRSTLRHSTLRHAQTRRTRLTCPTTLRHRSDTGQTPSTPSTPVSIDTAPTLLRHFTDTSDTSDTQTHQGSSRWRTSWSRDCGSEVSGVSPNHH